MMIFHEALRLERVIERNIAIDGYLASLLRNNPTIRRGIQLMKSTAEQLSLTAAMNMMAKQVFAVHPDGVLKKSNVPIGRVNPGDRGRTQRRLSKCDCKAFGLHHPNSKCTARPKKCRYCGMKNHFSSVCLKKKPDENKSGNETQKAKDIDTEDKKEQDVKAVRKASIRSSFVGMIHVLKSYQTTGNSNETSMVKAVRNLKDVGVDSQCVLAILNDARYFIHCNSGARSLVAWNETVDTGKPWGKASVV